MRGQWLSIWAPTPVTAYVRSPRRSLPWPLGEPDCHLFERARHALWHGVRAFGLGESDEVLVPAYHHGSEIEALTRAGLECRFYDASDDLEPDEDELATLVTPRTRALHLVHTAGFPLDAERWRDWCDRRSLLLFEDAAQSWLADRDGRPVGAAGHLAVFCAYKSVGVPLGAVLVLRGATVSAPPATGGATALRRLVRRHAGQAARGAPALRRLAASRAQPFDPVADIDLGDPATAPSGAVPFLLHRLADGRVAARRRANASRMCAALGALVPSPFDTVPSGAAPFLLPVAVDDKPGFLAHLATRRVEGADVWSIPHPSLPTGFPGAARRRATTVGLPVHQELSDSDVDRVIEAASSFRP